MCEIIIGPGFGFTVIVMVAVAAHNPAVGVNVYKVVVVLFNAGDQVPVTPLVEVVGNAASTAPEQTGATCTNSGTVSVPVDVIVTGAWVVQPLASFTVTVYDPAGSPVKTLLAWNVTALRLYVSAPVPPVAVAVIVPSLSPPQDAGDALRVSEGAGRFNTVTGID